MRSSPKTILALVVVGVVFGGLFSLPVVKAAPEVLPPSSSTYLLASGDAVYIANSAGNSLNFWEVTSPSGNMNRYSAATQLAFNGAGDVVGCPFVGAVGWVGFRFGSTTPFVGTAPNVVVVSNQIQLGEPGDGTWQIKTGITLAPRVCLVINGVSQGQVVGGPPYCLWNQHTAQLDNLCPPTGVSTAQPENNPNNARFFNDPATDSDPHPVTSDSTITCPSSLTVRGVWAKGQGQTLNTFVRFAVIDGAPDPFTDVTPTDLRDNPGVTLTTLTDDGPAANGDHTVTVNYNNAVGNSYQFLARNGTNGFEQLGAVAMIGAFQIRTTQAGQCTPTQPPITGFSHDPGDFDLDVSHAQCDGDKVAFNVDVDVNLQVTDLDVFIRSTETGDVTLSVDDSEMLNVPSGVLGSGVYFFNRTLNAGPWVAIAQLEVSTGLDLFDSKSFVVPFNDCSGSPSTTDPFNHTLIMDAISLHDTTVALAHATQGLYPHAHNDTMTTHHNNQGLTTHCNESENCDAGSGGGGGGAFDLQFQSMTVTESNSFLLFLLFMTWALWVGKPRIAFMSFIGAVVFLVGSVAGGAFFGGFSFMIGAGLVILGFWLETLVGGFQLRSS